MTNQEKIKGILRLILMLSGQKKYSLQEIRDRVQVSERTVFRYFEVIEDSGFLLERNNGYRLQKEAQTVKELKDRKSTRLNSSHVKISYAVFCLKKKKEER